MPTRSSPKPERNRVWITNASPVITLAKAGHLQIMSQLAREVLVPEPVARELLAADPADPARRAIEGRWGTRVAVGSISPRVLEWGLGMGESAVLTLATSKPGALAVVDDAEARKCARTLGIPIIGTLGAVARAKLEGHIESASEAIMALRDAGLYLNDETIAKALKDGLGEIWPPRRATP